MRKLILLVNSFPAKTPDTITNVYEKEVIILLMPEYGIFFYLRL